MGWHIIKRLLQAVSVLLVTLSRIEYQESNPSSQPVNLCNPSTQLRTASVAKKSVKSVFKFHSTSNRFYGIMCIKLGYSVERIAYSKS
jgi:hypothetical protein